MVLHQLVELGSFHIILINDLVADSGDSHKVYVTICDLFVTWANCCYFLLIHHSESQILVKHLVVSYFFASKVSNTGLARVPYR